MKSALEHHGAVSGGQPSACCTLECACHVIDLCFIELISYEKKKKKACNTGEQEKTVVLFLPISQTAG